MNKKRNTVLLALAALGWVAGAQAQNAARLRPGRRAGMMARKPDGAEHAGRGVEAALRVGAWLALGSGVGFGVLVALGLHHWSTVVLAQFMVMFAHGINMPCAQAGSTRPFPARAGAASGLSGCVMMVCAMAAGLVVAASFDGSMVPMSMCSVALGSAIFVLNRVWPPRRRA